jgi:DNA-binding NarL/FixJ family response regulator
MEKRPFAYQRNLKAMAEVRRKAILALKAQGKTWRQIGRELGISGQRAQQLGNMAKP